MSLRARLLNQTLRFFEKPHLARVEDPLVLRAGFERKARRWFRPPRGSRFEWAEIGGRPVLWALGPGVRRGCGPVILYFHGGGYVFGSPATHRAMLAHLSRLTGLPACLPDYRLAPEYPFPAAVNDAMKVFAALATHPGGVILGGDSAGGGLALAVLASALAQGRHPPRGAFAFSPLTDLTFSGASFEANAHAEAMLPVERAGELVRMYLQDIDPRDPRASPLRAEFQGAPPVWLTVGDTEILLDDTRRIASRMRAQGVAVTEVIERDLPHVWPIFHGLIPEAGESLRALADWIRSL